MAWVEVLGFSPTLMKLMYFILFECWFLLIFDAIALAFIFTSLALSPIALRQQFRMCLRILLLLHRGYAGVSGWMDCVHHM